MHKKHILMMCLVTSFLYTAGLVVAGEYDGDTLSVPLGTITLAPPDGVEAKRSHVEFPHSAHFGILCQRCHHQWEGDEEVSSCTTSGCHDLEEAPAKDDGDEPILYYKAAYHDLCIGCHKEISVQNAELEKVFQQADAGILPTGPTGCVKCHPKE